MTSVAGVRVRLSNSSYWGYCLSPTYTLQLLNLAAQFLNQTFLKVYQESVPCHENEAKYTLLAE